MAWRLRLKQGVGVATDEELDGAVAWLEYAEIVFGGIVFVGIALEVLIAFLHPEYDSLPGVWGPVVSDGFVGLGVLGEVLVSARVTLCQGEITKRAKDQLAYAFMLASNAEARSASAQSEAAKALRELGEANERAAQAEERTAEIERLTAWRRLSSEQQKILSDQLRPIALNFNLLWDVMIEYERGDTEAYSLARGLVTAFHAAGFVKIRFVANSLLDTAFGLFAASAPGFDIWPIVSALGEVGLHAGVIDKDLSAHLPTNQVAPNLYIFVAPKPAPPFELKLQAGAIVEARAQAHMSPKSE